MLVITEIRAFQLFNFLESRIGVLLALEFDMWDTCHSTLCLYPLHLASSKESLRNQGLRRPEKNAAVPTNIFEAAPTSWLHMAMIMHSSRAVAMQGVATLKYRKHIHLRIHLHGYGLGAPRIQVCALAAHVPTRSAYPRVAHPTSMTPTPTCTCSVQRSIY